MKTIVLGNPNPKAYRNNPAAPAGLPLNMLELFADKICGLDLSGVMKVGDTVMSQPVNPETPPEPLYTFTEAHRAAQIRELIEKPVEMPWLGGKCRTKIHVSPESKPSEALREIREVVKVAFNGPVSWIAGDDAALVGLIKEEFQIPEVRELDLELIDVPPKGN